MTTLTKQTLNDPSVRFWVKDQIKELLNRDVLDAANDAKLLADVLQDEMNASLGAHGHCARNRFEEEQS